MRMMKEQKIMGQMNSQIEIHHLLRQSKRFFFVKVLKCAPNAIKILKFRIFKIINFSLKYKTFLMQSKKYL